MPASSSVFQPEISGSVFKIGTSWFKRIAARLNPSIPREATEPLVYLVFILIFEVISDLRNPVLGNICHALNMVWLVYRGGTHRRRQIGRLLLCMSLCPMVRLVSLAMSPNQFHGISYYVTTEGTILIAGFFTVTVCGFSWQEVGIRLERWLWTTPFILLSGFVGGWIEGHIISAPPLTSGITFKQTWLACLLLVIFTGFTEEFIFRGLIQHAAYLIYKPWMSVSFSGLLWAILHIGWFSWIELGFILVVGLAWGTIRHFNRSILTLAITHGLANVMLFVVVPSLHH